MRVELNARRKCKGKCENESVKVVINEVPESSFQLTAEKEKTEIYQGLQTEGREGVCEFRALLRRCVFEGVTGRSKILLSGSARLMYCKGVKGEPCIEGDDLSERGLWPLGVIIENDGMKGKVRSGVRGGSGSWGGEFSDSGASNNVAELIHFCSWPPCRGGDSGPAIWKLSAK